MGTVSGEADILFLEHDRKGASSQIEKWVEEITQQHSLFEKLIILSTQNVNNVLAQHR